MNSFPDIGLHRIVRGVGLLMFGIAIGLYLPGTEWLGGDGNNPHAFLALMLVSGGSFLNTRYSDSEKRELAEKNRARYERLRARYGDGRISGAHRISLAVTGICFLGAVALMISGSRNFTGPLFWMIIVGILVAAHTAKPGEGKTH